jgi:hypothetical protein
LTGDPAAVVLVCDPVHVGDTIALAITLAASQTTVQASTAIGATDSAVTVAQRLAASLRPQLSGFEIAAYQPLEAGRGKLIVRSLGSGTFSLAPTVANPDLDGPATFVFLEQNGDAYPPPSYAVSDGDGVAANAVVVHGLLPVCDAIEAALLAASQNLSFGRVGSRTIGGARFEASELVTRNALLAQYRRALGDLLFPA